MKLINLNEWDLSFWEYSKWCNENKIPIIRVTLTKYRLKMDDFLFFKLKFDPAMHTKDPICDDDY